MSVEGQLSIRLGVTDKAVDRVSIESNRPVHASRVLNGKDVSESQQLIPLLFAVCGTAQSCAGVRACEQALGFPAAERMQQLRDSLVSMETLREHLWRILLDWPSITDAEKDSEGVTEITRILYDFRQALGLSGDPFTVGGTEFRADSGALMAVRERVRGLLRIRVYSVVPGEWLGIEDPERLLAWAERRGTVAARLIHRLVQTGWGAVGACDSTPLPPLSEQQLHVAFRQSGYVKYPRWNGNCCETSAMTRVESRLLEELKAVYGNGLLVRLVARLTEMAQLAERLPVGPLDSGGRALSSGTAVNPGIGQVAAARGQLVHRVELSGITVCNYQILAPTEWNFHPEGVVAQALSTLRGDPERVEQQARLLISAVDPCVGYRLIFN
ncbi:MAG: hypothetical protein GY703_02835 [Gammaproteobacteria bacterium]|nr:hypothetical protein [Gammaproteobacteria bacterium]